MTANKINFNEIFASANSAYIARHPNDANVSAKTGLNPSIEAGLNYAKAITEGRLEILEKLGVNWEEVAKSIAGASNVKKAMRAPLLLNFIASGDAQYLQGSAQTALLGFCALMIGAKNRNGLYFTVTNKGDENTSDTINLNKAHEVQKAFGKVGITTAPTQISVAFSQGGLLPMLGLCGVMQKGADAALPDIINNKLSRALVKLISTASNNTIEFWAKQASEKKRGTK